MFDALTKSKFYTKCKSSLKMTKTRLEALKRKKNTVIKYLKNDMADLLKNGVDDNAYNRVDGLIVEQNMIACYNFIEQFCGCIASNISVMNKQRECPEECRAAAQSLIFAAARFSEFPELRDLRTLFTERYGNLELYINKEFVGLLKSQPATKEKKLQLMHDIAHEFSIEWSSKSLEQKLFKPPEPQHDCSAHKPLNNTGEDRYNVKKIKADVVHEKNREDSSYSVDDLREEILRKRNERENASFGRKPSFDTVKVCSSSAARASEEEDNNKPFNYRFIPPPYVKPIVVKGEIKPVVQTYDSNDLSDEAKPKPRSMRRKPSKLASGVENFGGVDSPLKPPPGREKVEGQRKKDPGINPSALEKYEAKWGSKMSQVEDEEDEKLLDGILMHYSKKESPYHPSNDQPHLKPLAQRSKSEVPPPPEPAMHGFGPSTRHVRAASAQEMLSGCSVHPNLPDYDELAERIAAFKGK